MRTSLQSLPLPWRCNGLPCIFHVALNLSSPPHPHPHPSPPTKFLAASHLSLSLSMEIWYITLFHPHYLLLLGMYNNFKDQFHGLLFTWCLPWKKQGKKDHYNINCGITCTKCAFHFNFVMFHSLLLHAASLSSQAGGSGHVSLWLAGALYTPAEQRTGISAPWAFFFFR